VIATNDDQKIGKRVKRKLAIRLDLSELAGLGVLKVQAAVFPASHRVKKVIPENANDEWPEGKDFLPFNMSLGRLQSGMNRLKWFGLLREPAQCISREQRPSYIEQENQAGGDL